MDTSSHRYSTHQNIRVIPFDGVIRGRMSFKVARLHLQEFAKELNGLQNRIKELEDDILRKSEALARLERSKAAPLSNTVALLAAPRITLQHVSLKPTQTKVLNDHAFPEPERESTEASEIKPWLFLAGNIVARDESKLRSLGITRILNAAHTVCPNYFENEFKYTSFDLIDHPSETIDYFILNAIHAIEEARTSNTKILVHCHQGISRSASLVIAYVAWYDKLTVMDALMYVKARRKIVSPNAGFLNQLNHFEERQRRSNELPVLYVIAPHSDKVLALVAREVKDRNRPLIDEDDVFLLYEGAAHGGNILIRTAKTSPRQQELDIAKTFANWMVAYEEAFKTAKAVIVPFEDEKFVRYLDFLPAPS